MTNGRDARMSVVLLAGLMALTLVAVVGRAGDPSSTATYSQTDSAMCGRAVFPTAAPESQGLSLEALRQLADAVQAYVTDDAVVGAELLVVKNRHVVLHEAFGWRDRENGIPMERNTVFNIRSMTKPLTGAAIQLLMKGQQLSLDDRASDYLPGFGTGRSEEITIRQLLTHRSGLPLSILNAVDEYDSLYSMANAVGARGPEYAPGSRFWYSDAGADTLGAIVEIASGDLLDAFLQERLFAPLGMVDTLVYSRSTPADDPRLGRVARLYAGGEGNWSPIWTPDEAFYPFAWGSQSVYSTPLDYALFLAMWLDGGRAGEQQLLSPAIIHDALTPASRATELGSDTPMPTGFCNLDAHYGQMSILYVGRDSSARPEPVVIGHSGSDGTWAWAWPERDLMILYFTQSRGNATGIRLEALIDELLIHPELKAINEAARRLYEAELGAYVECLAPYRYREVAVVVQNGQLALEVPEGVAFELDPPDGTGWRDVQLMPGLSVMFRRDETGTVTGIQLREGARIHQLERGTAPEEPPLDLEAIAKYLGRYRDETDGLQIEVVLYNGRLACRAPGTPAPLELYPPDSYGWWVFRLNPSVAIRFNEDEDGRVISYTARSPAGVTVRVRVPEEAEPGE